MERSRRHTPTEGSWAALVGTHDPSAREDVGTSPFEWGGVHWSPLRCGPVGGRWHRGFRPGVHESTDSPPSQKHLHRPPKLPLTLINVHHIWNGCRTQPIFPS